MSGRVHFGGVEPFGEDLALSASGGEVRVRRYGSATGPLVIVSGGISSGRCLAGSAGWWSDLVGFGLAVDLHRFNVVGFDFAPPETTAGEITAAGQARLIEAVLPQLGVVEAAAWIGASYGGMVGLAFASQFPARLGRLCVISAAHQANPMAVAWRGVQRRIVAFAVDQGRGEEGMALARQLAMTTYRSDLEFLDRFDGRLGDDGRADVCHYLEQRGRSFARAMTPARWLALSKSIDRHRVEPRSVTVPTTLIASMTDRLVPVSDMQALALRLPSLNAFDVLPSVFGHDAFLKEQASLAPLLSLFLEPIRDAV